MSKPILLVIAGCNGAGKSSFSKELSPTGLIPFDYDLHYLNFYKKIIESEMREVMAHNMAFEELERQISLAIAQKKDFCYETNFNSTPLHWPKLFIENGYELRMIYLCLDSIEEAKRRVAIRVRNGGHFVAEDEIIKRYYEGFQNLNAHFKFFDSIDVFDTSAYASEPNYLFSIEEGKSETTKNPPHFLKELLPEILV